MEMMTMMQASSALLALFAALVLPRWAATTGGSRVGEVEAAFSQFSRAFAEADVPVLRGLLARNYTHVNGRTGSVLTGGEWLKWLQSRRVELDTGKLVISVYEIKDLVVQVYKEAAVVTGVAYSSGERDGSPFTSRVRFTNLWVVEEGKWRRAAFHDSPLPDDG
jgi:hypothetical protein